MQQSPSDPGEAKRRMRAAVRRRLAEQVARDVLSRQIAEQLTVLPEFARAAGLMTYIGQSFEVATIPLAKDAWGAGKRIVVPYCVGDELELFRLLSLDELAPGYRGIMEPRPELRGRADRRADLAALDLILVPGLAFDRRGGRLGRGKGYYDRLLTRAAPETAIIGLAFECQMVDRVPMAPRDVFVDKVITEAAVYDPHGRAMGG